MVVAPRGDNAWPSRAVRPIVQDLPSMQGYMLGVDCTCRMGLACRSHGLIQFVVVVDCVDRLWFAMLLLPACRVGDVGLR